MHPMSLRPGAHARTPERTPSETPSETDKGHGVAPDGAGGAFVVGFFDATATFGASGSLSSSGGYDAFVMR